MFEAQRWAAKCGVALLVLAGCGDRIAQPAAFANAPGSIPPPSAAASPNHAQVNASAAPNLQPTAASTPVSNTTPVTPVSSPVATLPVGPSLPSDPNVVGNTDLLIPTDTRPVVHASSAPVPISGGTLLISRDGTHAYASDPERDRVSVVDVSTQRVLSQVALQPGDEPGRLVQDDAGRVHVVLRGAGAVATLDASTFAVSTRRAVCAAPRGIAFDAASAQLHVACSGGEVVSLPAASGDVSVRVQVASDLRDIFARSGGWFVTRARRAELLKLDADRAVLDSARPLTPRTTFPEPSGTQIVDTLQPELARRALATRDGGVVMLHQGARDGDIELKNLHDPSGFSSAYGGAGTCTGVVSTEISVFDNTGHPTATAQIGDVLAVDIAESPVDALFAVAVAGSPDPNAATRAVLLDETLPVQGPSPSPTLPPPTTMPAMLVPNVSVLSIAWYDRSLTPGGMGKGSPVAGGCAPQISGAGLPAPATAVAFLNDGRLVAQTREPASLWIVSSPLANANASVPVQIALGGASMLDTGHELFHRDAGAGVACASCHLEGGDDGHVWHFVDQGPRRTQSLNVGLEGTAPFHWIGDMNDIATLMENVFVGRMGGVHQTPERSSALEQWLYAIRRPAPLRAASDPAAVRGQSLFEGEAQCSHCHNGAKFTNNDTVDVGTGLALQVPSLVGVGYRSPWLHTGCATTLRDRFDPSCGGGDKHGHTSQLSADQVGDLVAYLESL